MKEKYSVSHPHHSYRSPSNAVISNVS